MTATKDQVWDEIRRQARRFSEQTGHDEAAAISLFMDTPEGSTLYSRYAQADPHDEPQPASEPSHSARYTFADYYYDAEIVPRARKLVDRGICKTEAEAIERVVTTEPELYDRYTAARMAAVERIRRGG